MNHPEYRPDEFRSYRGSDLDDATCSVLAEELDIPGVTGPKLPLSWASKLGVEPLTHGTPEGMEREQGAMDILEVLEREGKHIETNHADFICTTPIYDDKRKEYFRQCFEWVPENNKWEGFVSMVGIPKEQLGDTTPISGAGQQALQSSLKIGEK
jgi:hypothetical protein